MMKESQLSDYDHEKEQALTELGYDVLNQVPLLGSLVKTFFRLHSADQRNRFNNFAKTLLQGVDNDEELLNQINGKEAEAFHAIFKTMASDMDTRKSKIYAFAYLFLVKEDLFHYNPPLADYLIATIKDLSIHEIELIKEIYAMLKKKLSNKVTRSYFKSLEDGDQNSKSFDFHKRKSVKSLLNYGLLAKFDNDIPIWSTEAFDIISTCIMGLDLHNDSLIKRNSIKNEKT